jgi:RimJ/RimL family protein N-acetyltransferase
VQKIIRTNPKVNNIFLREVEENDLITFIDHQMDPDAMYMAAFTAKNSSDKTSILEKWNQILNDDSIIPKTIVVNENIAGHIARFELFGKPEVTYWIGKEYWDKGIATKALELFLGDLEKRPLYARAAKDNLASIRVLEKCGFTIIGYEKAFANARGEKIEEVLFELK